MVPGGSDSCRCTVTKTVQTNQRPRHTLKLTDTVLATKESGQMTQRSAFWDDLARDMADPEFEREYAAESRRIAEFDEAMNAADTRPINPPPEHGG
jgi:hypothetical protein